MNHGFLSVVCGARIKKKKSATDLFDSLQIKANLDGSGVKCSFISSEPNKYTEERIP